MVGVGGGWANIPFWNNPGFQDHLVVFFFRNLSNIKL
jgi:hypothetical protein